MTKPEKCCEINHYEKTALSTGILINNAHIKKTASLEDALAYVIDLENFEKLPFFQFSTQYTRYMKKILNSYYDYII